MFTRGSGILLHISSMPSPYGIGDLGPTAYTFADKLRGAAQSYWQMLPLNPTTTLTYNSPYFSSSGIAGNPILISPEKLIENGLLDKTDIHPFDFPQNKIDYPAVTDFKYRLLEIAYRKFCSHNESEKFEEFCKKENNWLDDFALLMVLEQKYKKPWNRWPEEIKHRQPEKISELTSMYKEKIRQQKWYQFIFFEQWRELREYCNNNKQPICIIGDLPIYVSYSSVDVWVNPHLFKLDENLNPVGVSGVPPDYFSATGQLWNNPVYRWDEHETEKFKWWIIRMQKLFERFDFVRIDHFRGLVQYWEVPAGEKTAKNGSWENVPTYKLLDALIKNNQPFQVIAEDLGLITDDVRDAINHYEFPVMKVLHFAFGDNSHNPYLPHEYARNCIVYTGTHDNNTTKGWFEYDAQPEEKERFYNYIGKKIPIEECVWEMIRLAQSSVADCAIIPVQDILSLGSESRINKPGILEGYWEWRLSFDQFNQLSLDRLAEMTKTYGRAPDDTENH
jgi:4-alpha-glucanotransferase